MPLMLTPDEIRRVCLAVGSLVRAAACWGMEKTGHGDTTTTERFVHHFLRELLVELLKREPADAEIDWVWEV